MPPWPTVHRIALLALTLLPLRSRGDSFLPGAGEPGNYGVPYGWLGPRANPVWEQYRKAGNPAGFPRVAEVASGDPQTIRFENIRQYNTGTGDGAVDLSISLGVFFATAPALATPGQARLVLAGGTPFTRDVRVGFVEHLAAGNGAPLSTMVSNLGGDNGSTMDPYFGHWGVDGLYLEVDLRNTGTDWTVLYPRVQLVAAGSVGVQEDHLSEDAEIQVNVPEGPPNSYDLGVPSSSDLPLSWQLIQTGASTSVQLQLGPTTFSWVLDNGVDRHGLTQTFLSDGVPYQGGSLDLSSLVPMLYLGSKDEGAPSPPELEQAIEVLGSSLQLQGAPSSVRSGEKFAVTVTAVDGLGQVDPAYRQTVAFASSDPDAMLPPPYSFLPGDLGVRNFEVAFARSGFHSLTVMDQQTPGIRARQSDIHVHTFYTVGCAAGDGPPAGSPLLVLMVWAAVRRFGSRRSPRCTSSARGSGSNPDEALARMMHGWAL